MKKLLCFLSILILFGCTGSKEIATVNNGINDKNFIKLDKEISNNPDNYEAYFELAQSYYLRGNEEMALSYADSALGINPNYQEARYFKGELNFNRNNITAAYEEFLILLSAENTEKWLDKVAEATGLRYLLKQLTYGNFDNANPMYDKSGKRIVLQSNKNQNWDIHIVDLNSGEAVELITNSLNDESPVFAENNTILFTRQQNESGSKRDIYSYNLNDKTENPIIVHPADDWNPAPTQSGNTILFVSDREIQGNYRSKIFSHNIKLNQTQSLMLQDYDYSFPCVQSNKDRFLFTANSDVNYSLFDANIDGGSVSRLTSHNMDFGAPKYSPDGNKVVFFSRVTNNYDIYELDLRTENLKRLTNDSAKDLSPSYSPDGKRVAFYSDRNGRYQIFEIDLTQSISIEELKDQMRSIIAVSNQG